MNSVIMKNYHQELNSFDYYWRRIWSENGDPRVKGLFLTDSPWAFIVLSIAYTIFVTKIGPALMKKRKAFELRALLFIYNTFQVN